MPRSIGFVARLDDADNFHFLTSNTSAWVQEIAIEGAVPRHIWLRPFIAVKADGSFWAGVIMKTPTPRVDL